MNLRSETHFYKSYNMNRNSIQRERNGECLWIKGRMYEKDERNCWFMTHFRGNIKKREGKQPCLPCMRLSPRLWKPSMPKRLQSCRARWSLTQRAKLDGYNSRTSVSSCSFSFSPRSAELQTEFKGRLVQFVSPDARNPPDSVCEGADGHAQWGSVLRVHHRFQALAALLSLVCLCSLLVKHKVKYKEDGRKEMGVSLYSVLPNTLEMQHAKELGDMQSEVAEA